MSAIDIDGRVVTRETRARLHAVVEALGEVVADIDEREQVEHDLRTALTDLKDASERLLDKLHELDHPLADAEEPLARDILSALKRAKDTLQ